MFDLELLKPERVRPLLRREYEQLVEAGLLEDQHVELLDGVLVEMSPQGLPHELITARIHQLLLEQLDRRFVVMSHSSVPVGTRSMPEPDIAVMLAKSGFRKLGESLLLVEVSSSSLRKDRGIKAPLYARARIPVYWIVDVAAQTVEVYANPERGRYRDVQRFGRRRVVRPTTLPGVKIHVEDLFAPTMKKRRR